MRDPITFPVSTNWGLVKGSNRYFKGYVVDIRRVQS